MRSFLWLVALGVVALVAYLALWPVPIDAVAWEAPAAPGYTGPHAANERLARLNLIPLGIEAGPEHIVLPRDGKLYAAVASGRILRMMPDGSEQEVFVETGGRVLGFDFDAAANLIARDAMKNIIKLF